MWIERHAQSVLLDLEYARQHGMPLYPFADVLVVPESPWKKYGKEMKVRGKLSIRSKRTAKPRKNAAVFPLYRIS